MPKLLGLYERDYCILTDDEVAEEQRIETEKTISNRKYGKMNCYALYPKAVRHFKSLFPNNYIDMVNLKNVELLTKQCDEFEKLLENDKIIETNVKNFIQDNRYYHIPASLLYNDYNFGHHDTYVFKEFHLGTEYVADYLLIGNGSGGHQFVFVEVENPYGKVTLKNGGFGDTIRKGERQISDWQGFIEKSYETISDEFRKYTDKDLPDEFYNYDSTRMHYMIIAGRRKDFSFNAESNRLRRKKEKDCNVKIMHYDRWLENARKVIGQNTY